MNIHNNNAEKLSNENIATFNDYFNSYKTIRRESRVQSRIIKYSEYLTFESFLQIVDIYGYKPSHYEINDVKAEVGPYMDKTYFFVIMGRILNKMMTTEYLEELKRCFKSLDFDKNGSIEKDELMLAFQKYCSIPPSYDEITEIFNSFDLNSDEHITFDEFIHVIADH
jgi:Ca2+-binding EF-hand superfamily protein